MHECVSMVVCIHVRARLYCMVRWMGMCRSVCVCSRCANVISGERFIHLPQASNCVVCAHVREYMCICIGNTMRMRGYRIYTTEGEARGRVYSMTPNPNCITGLYQNAVAFPFPIGSSKTVQ